MAPERSEEEQAEKAFTVSDKRLFTKDGIKRPTVTPSQAPEVNASPPPRQAKPPEPQPTPSRPTAPETSPPRDLPAANLSNFVMMLASNVMMLLGQVPDPTTQQRYRDLPQARHTIDILMMLHEKTHGNLTPEEEQVFQELLPQLQMAYVQSRQQVGSV